MSSSNTRLYLVTEKQDPEAKPRLIEATSDAAALRHVTHQQYACRAAKPRDVADAMRQGAIPEVAGEHPVAPTPTPDTNEA